MILIVAWSIHSLLLLLKLSLLVDKGGLDCNYKVFIRFCTTIIVGSEHKR